jgi:hypothetical protein
MVNKYPKEPRVYMRMERLIEEGLCNKQVLAQIKKEFPDHRTRLEQVANERYEMRRVGCDIPTSVQARHRKGSKFDLKP